MNERRKLTPNLNDLFHWRNQPHPKMFQRTIPKISIANDVWSCSNAICLVILKPPFRKHLNSNINHQWWRHNEFLVLSFFAASAVVVAKRKTIRCSGITSVCFLCIDGIDLNLNFFLCIRYLLKCNS